MRALTKHQSALYNSLRQSARTITPGTKLAGGQDYAVARSLVRRGLARIIDDRVLPTVECIEFYRGIAARNAGKHEQVAA